MRSGLGIFGLASATVAVCVGCGMLAAWTFPILPRGIWGIAFGVLLALTAASLMGIQRALDDAKQTGFDQGKRGDSQPS